MTGSVSAGKALAEKITFPVHSVYRHTVNISVKSEIYALHPERISMTPLSLAIPLDGSEFDIFAAAAKENGRVKILLTPEKKEDSGWSDGESELQAVLAAGRRRWTAGRWNSWEPRLQVRLGKERLLLLGRLTAEFLRKYGRKKGGFGSAAALADTSFREQKTVSLETLLEERLQEMVWNLLDKGNPRQEGFAEQLVSFVGLGVGLTPSGDDFLEGVLLAFQTAQFPDTEQIREKLEKTLWKASAGTNDISGQYLRCACRGEYGIRFHRLMQACEEPQEQTAEREIWSALELTAGIGHSSGTDTLNGLLAGIRLLCGRDAGR